MTDSGSTSTASPAEQEYHLRQPIGDGRRTVTIALPRGWAKAALSGVEASLLGWAVPALLAVIGLLAEGSNPWMRGMDLSVGASIGTDFWALSLGAPIAVSGLPISLIPLLWTAVEILILRGLLAGGRSSTAAGLWAAIPSYMVTNIFVVAAAPGTTRIVPILLGSFLVSLLAVLWAVLSRSESYPRWFTSLQWVWSGIRTGAWWFLGVVTVGLATIGVSALIHRGEMAVVSADLGAAGFSGVLLALLQISYLPTMAAWALAWFSGAGFTIAEGDIYSSTSVVVAELPFFPVTEMLPATPWGTQAALVLVAVGVLCGGITSWRLRNVSFVDATRRVVVALLFFSFLVGVWFALSRGGLGAERMVALGPVDWAWPLVVAEVAGAAVVIVLLTHPVAVAAMRTGWNATVVFVGETYARVKESRGPGASDGEQNSGPRGEGSAEVPDGALGETLTGERETPVLEALDDNDIEHVDDGAGERTRGLNGTQVAGGPEQTE